jgi:hypothetical protein
MVLIACPACHREIDGLLTNCPHCRQSLWQSTLAASDVPAAAEPNRLEPAKRPEPVVTRGMIAAAGAIFGAVVGGLVALGFNCNPLVGAGIGAGIGALASQVSPADHRGREHTIEPDNQPASAPPPNRDADLR